MTWSTRVSILICCQYLPESEGKFSVLPSSRTQHHARSMPDPSIKLEFVTDRDFQAELGNPSTEYHRKRRILYKKRASSWELEKIIGELVQNFNVRPSYGAFTL